MWHVAGEGNKSCDSTASSETGHVPATGNSAIIDRETVATICDKGSSLSSSEYKLVCYKGRYVKISCAGSTTTNKNIKIILIIVTGIYIPLRAASKRLLSGF